MSEQWVKTRIQQKRCQMDKRTICETDETEVNKQLAE
jgi:hypothetical protein